MPSSSSSIECFLTYQTRHHGNGDNLCVMKDVSVNLGIFSDEVVTGKVIETYVGTKHGKQPYVGFPKGFIKANAKPLTDRWVGKYTCYARLIHSDTHSLTHSLTQT